MRSWRSSSRISITEFQEHYNHHRPHMGLGGLTPANSEEKSQATKEETEILYS